ncbi:MULTISPECIES: hypothetical protein [unclassified Sphingomonas]|uniref:hypothetical protein n=1 Tax=unclassified Sphingomonas TaxID=196159 RepID=UPI0009283C31|nr:MULTISPECIES: hypothetical protein [unclassified Sphingomonas]OJV33175.1 MAG: hypothetical protein BGO24_17205 [Sphingomonas sp. 67-36]
MAEPIDEATIVAWVDGELDEAAAARAAFAVEHDPALAEIAERHRRMKARFAAAFGPIADEAVAMPAPASATIHSLDAARHRRATGRAVWPRWAMPGAIAASLLVGLMIGHGMNGGAGVGDSPEALALSRPIATALDRQLSGESGTVRVALSFRNRDGDLCRSFAAAHLSGVACRAGDGWQLRYGSPNTAPDGAYRMAGGDAGEMRFVQSVIAGEPLDRAGEMAARAKQWAR